MNDELKKQREELSERAFELYSPDNFPGSAGWIAYNKAEKTLKEFDTQHPDIIAAIKAEKAAKDAAVADAAGWI